MEAVDTVGIVVVVVGVEQGLFLPFVVAQLLFDLPPLQLPVFEDKHKQFAVVEVVVSNHDCMPAVRIEAACTSLVVVEVVGDIHVRKLEVEVAGTTFAEVASEVESFELLALRIDEPWEHDQRCTLVAVVVLRLLELEQYVVFFEKDYEAFPVLLSHSLLSSTILQCLDPQQKQKVQRLAVLSTEELVLEQKELRWIDLQELEFPPALPLVHSPQDVYEIPLLDLVELGCPVESERPLELR